MTQNQLHLDVPYAPSLDSLPISEVAAALDECGVRRPIDCLDWPDQFPYHPLTVFTIAHSDKWLYIDFFVRCNYLRAVNTANNSDVYQDSCVEFFVQPKPDGPYFNFEFNCIGTAHVASRKSRHDGVKLTDAQLDSIKRYASCGSKPFNELEGFFSWNLTVAIPLELIGVEYNGSPITMRGNFYKCGDATSEPHYLSWAPIDTPKPDFHRPEFFAPITLC